MTRVTAKRLIMGHFLQCRRASRGERAGGCGLLGPTRARGEGTSRPQNAVERLRSRYQRYLRSASSVRTTSIGGAARNHSRASKSLVSSCRLRLVRVLQAFRLAIPDARLRCVLGYAE